MRVRVHGFWRRDRGNTDGNLLWIVFVYGSGGECFALRGEVIAMSLENADIIV